MKHIETTIYFLGDPIGKVISSEPFETLEYEGKIEGMLPENYHALINEVPKKITKQEPKEYVINLFQGFSGSYWSAGEAEIKDI